MNELVQMRDFDPANWRQHYASVRARLTRAANHQSNIREAIERAAADKEAREADTEMRIKAKLQWNAAARAIFRMEIRRREELFESAPNLIDSRQTIRRIVHEVSEASGVPILDLLSARRTHRVLIPRALCAWRARNETPKSFPQIGRMLGGRDHTTIIHAVRKIDGMIADGTLDAKLLATIPADVLARATQ